MGMANYAFPNTVVYALLEVVKITNFGDGYSCELKLCSPRMPLEMPQNEPRLCAPQNHSSHLKVMCWALSMCDFPTGIFLQLLTVLGAHI